jgi:hypothetical protein
MSTADPNRPLILGLPHRAHTAVAKGITGNQPPTQIEL